VIRGAGGAPANRAGAGQAVQAVSVNMEKSSAVEERVLELLRKKVGPEREIDLDSSVVEDTGLDSVSVMDFVMELEDEFDIMIPLDQIAEVRTVGDLAAAVRALADGQGAAPAAAMEERS
jgi:acyl carrier protein